MSQNNKTHSTARDVFLHLLILITLFISVINIITLLWQYTNILLPDQLDYYYSGILKLIRWGSASLIVAYPVFMLISWVLTRDYVTMPEKREIGVRKWLLYLTLFIAAIIIIIDLITLIYNFFDGELTLKFGLKLLIILIITGIVFGYYLWDINIKKYDVQKNRIFAWITSFIVVISIATGFLVAGTPMRQRLVRFDEQRINDLTSIQYQIADYWRNKQQLPQKLGDLTDILSGYAAASDPETNQPYEYKIIDGVSFELCATFGTESRMEPNNRPKDNWEHVAGNVCFQRSIDPDVTNIDVKPTPRVVPIQ